MTDLGADIRFRPISMAPERCFAHGDWPAPVRRANMSFVIATWTRLLPFVAAAAAASLIVGCGEERDSSRPMTAGERLSIDKGCTACHGANGEGGSGPAWNGLAGSQVQLSDGSTVTADDAYLTESIRDPSAKSVKGYGAMPANSLTDEEIAAVVEFITTLQQQP